ncbi:hypothetical protein ABT187_33305 [Streptomyces sp. NPDC001817]|uniref:hypothetical protein n=1 Tax=Streptomyces sp. NPDC001817 TaxID=3154398 RepID=UPI003317ECB0
MTTAQEPAQDAAALVAELLVRNEIKIGYPGVEQRAESGAAVRRAHRRLVPEDLRGRQVRQGRAPSRAEGVPGGRLVVHVFAALAEFIHEPVVIGTKEGVAAVHTRGRAGGRPSVATEEIIRAARSRTCARCSPAQRPASHDRRNDTVSAQEEAGAESAPSWCGTGRHRPEADTEPTG